MSACRSGLTVTGNHLRFTAIATYGPDALAVATQTYPRTAALIGA